MWTIYRDPRDYPGKVVARRWVVERIGTAAGERPTEDVIVGAELDEVRDKLHAYPHRPEHHFCGVMLARDPADEPQIVETWL